LAFEVLQLAAEVSGLGVGVLADIRELATESGEFGAELIDGRRFFARRFGGGR